MEYSLFDDSIDKMIVCGTDEAGRGPLAGPVVAASVVLPQDFPLSLLGDSKKLTEKQRAKAEIVIKQRAIAYSVCVIDNHMIDKINILQASLLGMKKSYEDVKLKTKVDILLCDGNKTPDVDCPVKAIVKGDSKVPEIMAASILAKNERDRISRIDFIASANDQSFTRMTKTISGDYFFLLIVLFVLFFIIKK